MELADVAHELYGLPPGDFTAERNDRAKELKRDDPDLAGQVRALAKATTAAWLVNQLVRHHGDEVDQVAAIGAALRDAQDDLDRDQLLQLNKQRHGVLRAVTQQARALAKQLGHPVSGAIADEVEQTLRAVMSDPDAADAVRTGTLLRSLSSTGFGAVDLEGAVAVPAARSGTGRRPAPARARDDSGQAGRAKGGAPADRDSAAPATKDELAERRRAHAREQQEQEHQEREQQERERREREEREQQEREKQERERAEKALAEARRQAAEADEAAARADAALDEAQTAVDDLAQCEEDLGERVHELERAVRDAQNELTAVQREGRRAERDRDRARHESEVAHRAADRARHRVERLT